MGEMMTAQKKDRARFERRDHFGGATHSYRLDGVKVPGVTTLLGGIPKPALINWAAGTVADYAVTHWDELAKLAFSERLTELRGAANRKRNAAGLRGTEVHSIGSRLVVGERVEGIADEVAGKVDQYVRFLNEWKVEPLLVEAAICNMEVPYGGTLDLIFRTPLFPDRVFLGDIKTSGGVYGETSLQLEAYGRADFYIDPRDGKEYPLAGLGVTDHVVIHLQDNAYRVIKMVSGDEPWGLFLHAAAIARAMEGARRVRSRSARWSRAVQAW
jgi:hypothetical protein